MKKMLFILFSITALSFAATYEQDYVRLKTQASGDYARLWQYARAAYYYGEYEITNEDQKKVIFTEAKESALQAVTLEDKKPEGHYWLGVAYGAWAEANGILNSLQLAGTIAEEMTKVLAIDPTYNNGSAFMVRGRVYAKAPGWPLSVGDGSKAEADFKQALKYGPVNRKAYRFYAEYLLANGRTTEATTIIKRGLAVGYNADEGIPEKTEITKLKSLLPVTRRRLFLREISFFVRKIFSLRLFGRRLGFCLKCSAAFWRNRSCSFLVQYFYKPFQRTLFVLILRTKFIDLDAYPRRRM